MNTTTLAQQLLPKEAYFSQRWFDEERKHLFDQSWIFLVSKLNCLMAETT